MNTMRKTERGYEIIDGNGKIVAVLIREKKGFRKYLISNVTGEWFTTAVFSFFYTVRDIKRYFEIE